jgi:plasmid stability protein
MEPKRKLKDRGRDMTVSLSIKKVPERLVARLRRRAAAHHRSLQGELLSVLEEAVSPKRASVSEVRERLVKLGLRTADQSTKMIREDRDAR